MGVFYTAVIRIGPALLLFIAAMNLVGSMSMAFTAYVPGGVLFGLSAALASTVIPLIATSVLLRFDLWFAAWRQGDTA